METPKKKEKATGKTRKIKLDPNKEREGGGLKSNAIRAKAGHEIYRPACRGCTADEQRTAPHAAWCRIHSPSGIGEQERAFQEMLFNMMALSWSL